MNFEIPLYYCSDICNFGDELSPYLINKITGQEVVPAKSGERLYAVGSILSYESVRAPCVVWGSGTLCHNDLSVVQTVRLFPLSRSVPTIMKRLVSAEGIKADVRAVRGPLTRKDFINGGGDCPEVYGDPAIVMPRFYQPVCETRYETGMILHHTQETEEVRELAQACGIHLISIKRSGSQQLEAFIDEICSCRKVFSTSLHGIILAQAYDVPVRWIQVKRRSIHRDAEHKFVDYFLGAGVPAQAPIEIELTKPKLKELTEVMPGTVHIADAVVDRLLGAFPFDKFPAKKLC